MGFVMFIKYLNLNEFEYKTNPESPKIYNIYKFIDIYHHEILSNLPHSMNNNCIMFFK